MGNTPNLDDYVEVAERITAFHEKFPEGTLQSSYEYLFDQETGRPYLVVVEARAFRTPDDPRPAVGLAAEPIPGKTPYTRESELQNAETAAFGRAIVAVGAASTKRGVASREEVRNRSAEPDNLVGLKALGDMCAEKEWTTKEQKRVVANAFSSKYHAPVDRASTDDLEAFVALVSTGALVIEFDTPDEPDGG